MPNLIPNNIYEAILSGEQVTPTSREQAFLQEAVQNGINSQDETYWNGEIDASMVSGDQVDIPLPTDPNLPAGATLVVDSAEYPLTDVSGTEFVYESVYNYDTAQDQPIDENEPWFVVQVDEVTGRGNDVLPGLLGGADTTSYLLTIATGEDLVGADVSIVKKAEVPSGGGLPEVTSEDNGDVLTVVEGAWAKSNPPTELPDQTGASQGDVLAIGSSGLEWATPSGAEELVCTFSFGEGITCDKSVTEILAALDAGQPVVGVMFDGEHNNYLPVFRDKSNNVWFSYISAADSTDTITAATLHGKYSDETDSWTLEQNDYKTLPSTTSQNVGSALVIGNAGVQWDSDYKPTYSFAFTVTVDQQDPSAYVCTPAAYVSFAAITAALAETDNVYAVATLPDGEVLKAVFDDISQNIVSADGMFYTGSSFTAYRVRLQSDETCDIALVALAAAQ